MSFFKTFSISAQYFHKFVHFPSKISIQITNPFTSATFVSAKQREAYKISAQTALLTIA